LRPSEISELEGIDRKSSSVRQLIIRTSDQLQAGELSLIEVTPEQAELQKFALIPSVKSAGSDATQKRNSPYKPNS